MQTLLQRSVLRKKDKHHSMQKSPIQGINGQIINKEVFLTKNKKIKKGSLKKLVMYNAKMTPMKCTMQKDKKYPMQKSLIKRYQWSLHQK